MLKHIFTSRKFWAMLAAVAGSIAAALSGEIAWSQAITLIVAAIGVYIGATGIEDAGRVANK